MVQQPQETQQLQILALEAVVLDIQVLVTLILMLAVTVAQV
jgi:hypothetical protein